MASEPVPDWLRRLLVGGFLASLLLVLVVAAVLALGAADPHPVGSLAWKSNFIPTEQDNWQLVLGEPGNAVFDEGGLTFDLSASDSPVFAWRPATDGTYTLTATGAQLAGPSGALYGIVFGYIAVDDYAAVLINNNGFVLAYRQNREEQIFWLPLQQWPHVLLEDEKNELRVDVEHEATTILINSEVLLTVPNATSGGVGVLAIPQDSGQVVQFSSAQFWSE